MSRWTDIATWHGLPGNNFGDGDRTELESADAMADHQGLVVHIAEGTFDGTISWERNDSSDVSSHFVVAKDGRIAQMLDTRDRSWCQASGNSRWLSVECEGWHTGDLTAAQVRSVGALLARAHREYGVPLATTSSTSGRGLGHHAMGGAAWGGHYDCPGPAIIAQKPAIVAAAAALLEGDDMGLAGELIEALNNGVTTATPSGAHCELTVRQIRADNFQVGTTQTLAAIAADAKAGRIAVEALAAAVRAGGGSVDTAAIVAHMDQLADADRTREEQQLARITELEEQLRDRDARLAAALTAPAGS